ncbi:LeuA family protein [Amycolatopsis anabasis]|uniref:LeuA family protein n=1 Tax=Amycolatopsis anabasis TaxID=1840409 RepID=UPI00131E8329|nr:homocitrate synthase [Amycolatopsis anabasis]
MTDTDLTDSPNRPTTVEVIDCTLRDGEQTPGVWFTVEEKVRLAGLLADAGIGLLDAGFPAASDADLEAMQEMRHSGVAARLGATARPLRRDIAAAAKARADEVFMFMPTSDLRLRETVGVTRDQAAHLMRTGADEILGEGMGLNVVFEDSTRADPAHLIRLVDDLCAPGAVSRLILADSVGCAHPAGMRALVRTLAERLDPSIAICTHAHNDYGLATANTLAAVDAGARAITCTVNGIGERAGNADLAECVAALTHLYGIGHGVRADRLPELAGFVERASGIHMSAIKPVTGFNVYRHESGVHVDSMLKDTRSYEVLPPRWTGRERGYVLGKHSGASLIRHILSQANPPRDVDEETSRRLVEVVKQAVENQDKTQHEQAYAAKDAFIASALAGISPDLVITEYDRLAEST